MLFPQAKREYFLRQTPCMKTLKLNLVVLLSVMASMAYGQNICPFKIDSLSIWTNRTLDSFLITLQKERFQTYTDKQEIPGFLLNELNCWTGGNFSLANPDEDYQCCCTSSKNLPKRKLQYI